MAKKVDNSNEAQKKALRKMAVAACRNPERPAVLDAFAGYGKMWEGVDMSKYTPIEKNPDKNPPGVIHADNVKVLRSIDLSKYDVIDLDAYGFPTKQLCAIIENGSMAPGTVVIYTAISNRLSSLASEELDALNAHGINEVAKTMASMFRFDAFKAILSRISSTGTAVELSEDSIKNGQMKKHYGFTIC